MIRLKLLAARRQQASTIRRWFQLANLRLAGRWRYIFPTTICGQVTVPREEMRCEGCVLHATWVQHSVTSQPAEAANGGGHMGDKNYVFGDDPEAVN